MQEALKRCFAAGILTLLASQAAAELQIEITQGAGKRAPVAVVPFGWEGNDVSAPLNVGGVIGADLQRSGRFGPIPEEDMLQKPTAGVDVDFDDWSILGVEAVIVGRVTQTGANAYSVQFQLFDFATKIAYVTAEQDSLNRIYTLVVSDADGENEHTIMESTDPIMSPAWSPDGRRLAYVSFEGHKSTVFVQTVRTGNRIKVSSRTGINGAPAFSPDGRNLVLTLGGADGNLDIHVMDLSTKDVTRLTTSRAIDTEGSWSPDGKQIYFTSDRSGGPQVYRIDASGGAPERITFEGSYNARPRLSPDGSKLAMVHLDRGNYRIGVLDLDSGDFLVLSTGRQDESPSFAPNSDTLIYATRQGQNGVLETVSADGLIRQRMGSGRADVREPVWSPFPRL
jgi:TolB protein